MNISGLSREIMNQEGPVRHVRAGPSAMYVCSWVLSQTHVLAGTDARTCLEDAVALPLFLPCFSHDFITFVRH